MGKYRRRRSPPEMLVSSNPLGVPLTPGVGYAAGMSRGDTPIGGQAAGQAAGRHRESPMDRRFMDYIFSSIKGTEDQRIRQMNQKAAWDHAREVREEGREHAREMRDEGREHAREFREEGW